VSITNGTVLTFDTGSLTCTSDEVDARGGEGGLSRKGISDEVDGDNGGEETDEDEDDSSITVMAIERLNSSYARICANGDKTGLGSTPGCAVALTLDDVFANVAVAIAAADAVAEEMNFL
jgi:hypothetical protein